MTNTNFMGNHTLTYPPLRSSSLLRQVIDCARCIQLAVFISLSRTLEDFTSVGLFRRPIEHVISLITASLAAVKMSVKRKHGCRLRNGFTGDNSAREPATAPLLEQAELCYGHGWYSIACEATMANLGYVGLGSMGGRIAKRLMDAGHVVTGYNRTKSRAQWLLDEGMKWGDSPRTVADTRA